MSTDTIQPFKASSSILPVINKGILYDKASGKLKKKAPNAYMLYRLHVIKVFKGKGFTPNQIHDMITILWKQLSIAEKSQYTCASREMQMFLDKANTDSFLSVDSNGSIISTVPNVAIRAAKIEPVVPRKQILVSIPIIFSTRSISSTDIIPSLAIDINCTGMIFPVRF